MKGNRGILHFMPASVRQRKYSRGYEQDLKDIIVRSKSMSGILRSYIPGWDPMFAN